ncbi:MAG TPA: FAD-dependent oxidoreductase [Rectinemataceae bacterium]|nr:FAD-dependent oxidoreductase [Rectinemataceae bacterium]
MERLLDSVKDCLQNEQAFCTAACPFHFDVRDFIEKIQRGSFNSAYRGYLNAVAFPGIVSALCEEPCRSVCPRGGIDASISLRTLEVASMRYARRREPDSFNLPAPGKRVAIVGAGPSGLACALSLSRRKYEVTVYERESRRGGHLLALLPAQLVEEEIALQFMHERCEFRYGHGLQSLEEVDADAIYVATGRDGSRFSLEAAESGATASTTQGRFLGGSLAGLGSMEAISSGLLAADAIERWLKAGTMNHPEPRRDSALEIDTSSLAVSPAIHPGDGAGYSREEAREEARRCLRCSCDACIRSCDLMTFFGKYPRRIAEEIEITVHPGTLDGNGTVATRLLSTCTHCGLCREVCPKRIDVGELILRGHRAMREKGAMPWAFHDFFLRDLEFANGEASLARGPRGGGTSELLFFPGCQLGASDPRYVLESYRRMLEAVPASALYLGCCGAPGEWAGDETPRDLALRQLEQFWEKEGRPTIVCACPSCRATLLRHLPQLKTKSLYALLEEFDGVGTRDRRDLQVSVFDPCSARADEETRSAVRNLARRSGARLVALAAQEEEFRCCGYGGQVALAHPGYARYVTRSRISGTERPFVTYCSNCRDAFAAAGKEALHILDLIFGLNPAGRGAPTWSERRRNRLELRRRALGEFWNGGSVMDKGEGKLTIAPDVARKLSDAYILEENVQAVIAHSESSGRRLRNPATGAYTAHLKIGEMTYWAEYRVDPAGPIILLRAWSHRMSIDEGSGHAG